LLNYTLSKSDYKSDIISNKIAKNLKILGLDGIFNKSRNVKIAIAELAAAITSTPANGKTVNITPSPINNNAFIGSNSKNYLLLQRKRLNKKKTKLEDRQALETKNNKVIK
jgi:hypothetical protein